MVDIVALPDSTSAVCGTVVCVIFRWGATNPAFTESLDIIAKLCGGKLGFGSKNYALNTIF